MKKPERITAAEVANWIQDPERIVLSEEAAHRVARVTPFSPAVIWAHSRAFRADTPEDLEAKALRCAELAAASNISFGEVALLFDAIERGDVSPPGTVAARTAELLPEMPERPWPWPTWCVSCAIAALIGVGLWLWRQA